MVGGARGVDREVGQGADAVGVGEGAHRRESGEQHAVQQSAPSAQVFAVGSHGSPIAGDRCRRLNPRLNPPESAPESPATTAEDRAGSSTRTGGAEEQARTSQTMAVP